MVEVEAVRLVVVTIRADKSGNVYQDPHKVSASDTAESDDALDSSGTKK